VYIVLYMYILPHVYKINDIDKKQANYSLQLLAHISRLRRFTWLTKATMYKSNRVSIRSLLTAWVILHVFTWKQLSATSLPPSFPDELPNQKGANDIHT